MLLLLLSYSAFVQFLTITFTKIQEAVKNSFVFRCKFYYWKAGKNLLDTKLWKERDVNTALAWIPVIESTGHRGAKSQNEQVPVP